MVGKLIKLARFGVEYARDFGMAVRYNTYSPFEDRDRRFFYRIVILSHAIEKGLSLVNPRELFGRQKIESIMFMVRRYDPAFSTFPLEMARGALQHYVRAHRDLGVHDPFLDQVQAFADDPGLFEGVAPRGGIKTDISVYRDRLVDTESSVAFLRSRFSCRAFEPRVVPAELLNALIATAQSAPSQCNRQSVRVHCYQDKATIERLLLLQGGAGGYHERVYNLFVISSETTAWGGFGQRSQGYVDGGLLAQSLGLACHAHGLGACMLNLAIGNAHENRIKDLGGIHRRERLIMMIAFGYPIGEGLKAASSPRLPVDHVLQRH